MQRCFTDLLNYIAISKIVIRVECPFLQKSSIKDPNLENNKSGLRLDGLLLHEARDQGSDGGFVHGTSRRIQRSQN